MKIGDIEDFNHENLANALERANKAERERDEANAEIARLEKALGDLYWHLTNGKLSKPYDFKAIESTIDDEITELVNREKAELTDLVLAAMEDPPRQPKDAGNWEERARRAVG